MKSCYGTEDGVKKVLQQKSVAFHAFLLLITFHKLLFFSFESFFTPTLDDGFPVNILKPPRLFFVLPPLADLYNPVGWMVSACLLFCQSSNNSTNPLVTETERSHYNWYHHHFIIRSRVFIGSAFFLLVLITFIGFPVTASLLLYSSSFCNVVIWIVSFCHPPISSAQSLFQTFDFSDAPTIIAPKVTLMFHNFFSSRARSTDMIFLRFSSSDFHSIIYLNRKIQSV